MLKTLYFDVFGIKADLNGITINPIKYLPFKKMFVSLFIRCAKFNITLEKANGKREFLLNGKKEESNNLRFEGKKLFGEYSIIVKI